MANSSPPQPTYQIHRPKLMLYPSGQGDQHVIPGGMAQGVVDLFEAITVEVEQRKPLLLQTARGHSLIQTSLKKARLGRPVKAS